MTYQIFDANIFVFPYNLDSFLVKQFSNDFDQFLGERMAP